MVFVPNRDFRLSYIGKGHVLPQMVESHRPRPHILCDEIEGALHAVLIQNADELHILAHPVVIAEGHTLGLTAGKPDIHILLLLPQIQMTRSTHPGSDISPANRPRCPLHGSGRRGG